MDVLVFSKVKLLPPVLRPSNATLSAPLNSISGPAMAPVIARAAPPEGTTETLVYKALPVPDAFRAAVTVSVVLPTKLKVIMPW
ncbi:MAG: hypothetical protein IPH36_01580 [Saprospiraceae bacterium]|nr:hypothetical protein [Saprospiraceae bacterium]